MSDLLSIVNNRKPATEVLAGLTSTRRDESIAAGQNLILKAKSAGLNIRDYLRLAIEPVAAHKEAGLDGYEVALATLNLPLGDDYSKGVVLQAAADTFATFPGVRALFPEVIDDVVQYKYRQTNFETIEPMVAQSRVINGTEIITTVVDDNKEDYQTEGMIAEGARIPVRSIRMSDKSVRIWKFGSGIEWTYEFSRRASLDLITPYAARMRSEVERAQVAVAYGILSNGDGVHAPAPVVAQTAVATEFGLPAPTLGRINWDTFLAFLVRQSRAGTPVDTVVGNWDMYFQWVRMFATPTADGGPTQSDLLSDAGVTINRANPNLTANINFVLASSAPANQLLCYSRQDTLEELIENASDIEESQKFIENQKVKYFHTINRGFRLVFGDTRSILNLAA